MEKAGIQGYLTTDDLMEVFPDSARNSEKLRALFATLQHRGVDVIDTDEEAASDTAPEADSSLTDLDSHSNEHLSGDDPIGLYLKEMTRVPLLSMEDELSIAIRIEKGRRAKAELLALGSRNSTASRRKLELLVQDGGAAREHLIKANTRLVVSIAKRYVGRGVAFLDLIQEGNLGLMKAVEKYDYHRGFRFSTYATWWIRQTISRALADQARTIRVPVHMIDRIRMLYKATYALEQKLGRQPTIEELAENVKLSVEKVQWIHKVSWQPLSLEAPVGGDGESEMGMFIQDDLTPSPQQNAYESMLKDKLEEVLTSLSPREARVLRLRFGLDDGNIYTLEEVGQKFGLTRERIRQIEGKALRQLRNPRKARELKEYL
ncbi:MAG: sigma-70 family RNA polymerase sigma factor [Chloroflexi bacterium]|nr:sigma-70 family RNA polymerase sigma factor [Chloroflexota bacterium]